MFRDLKEYQKIQDIYQTSVYANDQERQLIQYIEEQEFTEEELLILSEHTEEVVKLAVEGLLAEKVLTEEFFEEEKISKEELIEGLGSAARLAARVVGTGLKRTFSNPALRKGVKGVVKGGKQAIKNTAKKIQAGLGGLVKSGKDTAKKIGDSSIVKGVGNVVKKTAPLAAVGGISGGTSALITAKMLGGKNKKTESGSTSGEKTSGGGGKTSTPTRVDGITGEVVSGGGSKGGSSSSAGSKTGTSFANAIKLNTSDKKTTPTTDKDSGEKKMGAIEKKNRERFGNKRVDFLKQKQKDFKSMDRSKFREKYPNSQSAKDAKRNKSPMDMRNESLQIANELASVYQKMYQTPSEESLTEDVKNYNALVEFIIKENIVSTVEEADSIIAEIDDQLIESYLTEGVISEGLMNVVKKVAGAARAGGDAFKKGVESGVDKAKQTVSNVKDKVKTAIQTKVQQGRDLKSGGIDKLKQGNQLRKDTATSQQNVAKKTEMSRKGDVSAQSGMGNDPGRERAKLAFLKNKRAKMNQNNSGSSNNSKKVPSPMDMRGESTEKDAYTTVLEYLLTQNHAATIEEANYIMTELDAETIQGIISES